MSGRAPVVDSSFWNGYLACVVVCVMEVDVACCERGHRCGGARVLFWSPLCVCVCVCMFCARMPLA